MSLAALFGVGEAQVETAHRTAWVCCGQGPRGPTWVTRCEQESKPYGSTGICVLLLQQPGTQAVWNPMGKIWVKPQSWHIQEINQCECAHVCVHIGAHGRVKMLPE